MQVTTENIQTDWLTGVLTQLTHISLGKKRRRASSVEEEDQAGFQLDPRGRGQESGQGHEGQGEAHGAGWGQTVREQEGGINREQMKR